MSDVERPAAGLPLHIRAQQVEKLPPCQSGCPNSGDIRGWLGIIAQRRQNGLTLESACDRAWQHLAERNPLPATLGRICPHPCEDLCTRRDKDGAVSINAMERFLGDWAISRALALPLAAAPDNAESVGVIGSGPAGLSFAYQMARRGYPVTLYEEHTEPGGMLRRAIPEYRLPTAVLDAEIERVLDLDIALVTNVAVGLDVSLEELRDRHDIVFLGLGAQAARRLRIPGEDGPGVIPGIVYLERRNAGDRGQCGERVLVVGGGNTAIDAARSARRDGASVTLLYRRGEAEMPAAEQDVADARAEGVAFRFLTNPTRILRDGGSIRGVEIQEMRLGDPAPDGRRRPLPVPGSLHEMPADTVIVAVAQAPGWQAIDAPDADRAWLQTMDDGRLDAGLWAGGDDRGPGIAGKAIAQGRIAAESAHARLRGEAPVGPALSPVKPGSVKTDFYAERRRIRTRRRAAATRLAEPEREIEETITVAQACAEAARCMSCGLCFDCRQCFMYCNAAGFTRLEETAPGRYFVLALEACEGCGKCIEICPSGYLEPRDTLA